LSQVASPLRTSFALKRSVGDDEAESE
jgi:hypothetical protein